MKSRFETKGFEDYLEKLAKAGEDIDAISDEALEAGGEILVSGMVDRVPKDTRNLENHIEASDPVKDGNVHYIHVGLAKNTDAKTARYGNVQEFGSANVDAHPYFRPTMDNDMRKARAKMKEVFEDRGAL